MSDVRSVETVSRVEGSADSQNAHTRRSSLGAAGRLVRGGMVLLALVGAGVFVWGRMEERAQAPAIAALVRTEGDLVLLEPDGPQLRYVHVETARSGPALPPVPAPARVTVLESSAAPVFAPLAGRIEQVVVQLGQAVKAGQKLVAIRSSSVPELGRDIESARAALSVRTAAVERVRALVALRAVPEKDLLLAEQERREAEIALRAAESKRRSLKLGAPARDGLYWISAPRAGTIVDRRALVGMEVGPDRTEPLLTVAELGELVVVADLLEGDVAGLAAGQKALVESAPGEPGIEGTVEYVAAVVDPLRRTVGVRVRVSNPGHRLRPNAFAQVTFAPPDQGGRIVVPAEAVVTDGQRQVVFVAVPGADARRFDRRPVRVGRTRDGKTEIVDGLREGESYVARGALLLLNALDLGA